MSSESADERDNKQKQTLSYVLYVQYMALCTFRIRGGAVGDASGARAPPIFGIFVVEPGCQFVQKCNKNVVEKNNPLGTTNFKCQRPPCLHQLPSRQDYIRPRQLSNHDHTPKTKCLSKYWVKATLSRCILSDVYNLSLIHI